mmetsp:Transcript_7906/g.18170  ORF Transcript_7906/g.18170 Transcript_7906/m.18170 type:complete len:213 (-) Transcript_7906:602-1240(-)
MLLRTIPVSPVALLATPTTLLHARPLLCCTRTIAASRSLGGLLLRLTLLPLPALLVALVLNLDHVAINLPAMEVLDGTLCIAVGHKLHRGIACGESHVLVEHERRLLDLAIVAKNLTEVVLVDIPAQVRHPERVFVPFALLLPLPFLFFLPFLLSLLVLFLFLFLLLVLLLCLLRGGLLCSLQLGLRSIVLFPLLERGFIHDQPPEEGGHRA